MRGEYTFEPGKWTVTEQMVKDYDELGFILVRGLFNKDEIEKINKALTMENGVAKYSYGLDDGHERRSRLVIWGHPGNDVTGMVGRCEKVVKTSEKLMGGEVYHYHTKVIMKEPHTGGSFVFHQDYGYWYANGNLKPDMNTVYIAVDRQDMSNGCMQIVPGSHRCGRIDHVMIGAQRGCDLERVNAILKAPGYELVPIELNPGDTLIFHCNIIHKSEQNNSPRRRYAILASYNRRDNNPVYEHHHPQYTPLEMVPDSAIMECQNFTELSGKMFVDPKKDKSVQYNEPDEKKGDAA